MNKIKFPSILTKDFNPGEASEELLHISISGTMPRVKESVCTWRPKGRLDWQIIYICDGYGYFQYEGKVKKIGPSSLVVFKPHEPQMYAYFEKDFPNANYIHFSGTIVEELMTKLKLTDKPFYNIDACYKDEIVGKFLKFHSLSVLNHDTECFVWGLLIDLLSELSEKIDAHGNAEKISLSKHDKDLALILEHMHNSISLQYSVADYAKKINMSPSYFAHVFKKKIGVSPIQYRNSLRLNCAKQLLLNSTMSIEEIAYEVGYSNVSIFSKKFKEATKLSPLNYRKSQGGQMGE